MLNWIYINRDTYEVKYGIRLDAQPNFHAPYDCTRLDRRLTFDGWEGFCAVEDGSGNWSLYFDRDDDGLNGKLPEGTRVLEIELSRVERRVKKDATQENEEPGAPKANSSSSGTADQESNGAMPFLDSPRLRELSIPVTPSKIPLPQSPEDTPQTLSFQLLPKRYGRDLSSMSPLYVSSSGRMST